MFDELLSEVCEPEFFMVEDPLPVLPQLEQTGMPQPVPYHMLFEDSPTQHTKPKLLPPPTFQSKPTSLPSMGSMSSSFKTEDSEPVMIKKVVSFNDVSLLGGRGKTNSPDRVFQDYLGEQHSSGESNMEILDAEDFLSEFLSQQGKLELPDAGGFGTNMKRQFKSCPDFSAVGKSGKATLREREGTLQNEIRTAAETAKKLMKVVPSQSSRTLLNGPVPIKSSAHSTPSQIDTSSPALSGRGDGPILEPFFHLGSGSRMVRSKTVPSGLHLLSPSAPFFEAAGETFTGKDFLRESRRWKRLTRSREYAKNRREQKKTIKQQLEQDAEMMKKGLDDLSETVIGDKSYDELMELYSMSPKGVAYFSNNEECIKSIKTILQHQLSILQDMEVDIREILMIPWILGSLLRKSRNDQNERFPTEDILFQLAQSLQARLNLRDNQRAVIEQMVSSLKEDLLRIKALQKVYEWLQGNDWANTPNSHWAWQALNEIFNEQQRKKLQRWCESNKDAIRYLDLVSLDLSSRSADEKEAIFSFGLV